MIVESTEHFSAKELRCRCGNCEPGMDSVFMGILERVRVKYAAPLVITSAYRCPAYNAQVSGTGSDGPHTTRQAVDIAIRGTDSYDLLAIAIQEGMTGIGIKQHGNSRFIHLDNLEGPTRPWIWSYK